jgi:hypothetical protein
MAASVVERRPVESAVGNGPPNAVTHSHVMAAGFNARNPSR